MSMAFWYFETWNGSCLAKLAWLQRIRVEAICYHAVELSGDFYLTNEIVLNTILLVSNIIESIAYE